MTILPFTRSRSRLPLRLGIGAALSVASLVALSPQEAEACGGTFCDGGAPMAVNQTGETILFRLHDGRVEAHVQIAYNGDPSRFAWLVPVTAIPEVKPGSSQLFINLLNSTVPTYFANFVFAECGGFDDIGFGCGAALDTADIGSAEFDSGGEGGEEGGGPADPEVVARGQAGAFEYAVLMGQSTAEIVNWLEANGYAQDPDAPPILDEYVQEGFYFLALKLVPGAGVDEIHPVAFDYEGSEPCVPIRLTRIAAEEDMGIRTFFLGEERYAPKNFFHVVLNQIAVSWRPTPGADYSDVVTLAVDEAGGKAFVTEYAGPSNVVDRTGLVGPTWSAQGFANISPDNVVAELEAQLVAQGFLFCGGGTCGYTHPLMSGIIDDFIVPPDGVTFGQLWACTSCYADQVDLSAWDSAVFAQRVDERIIAPGVHANEILTTHSYLTRMYTTMSPHEMTEDPMFWENPDLPDVAGAQTASQLANCEGPAWYEFPSGRRLALADNFSWPLVPGMPVLEKVERIPAVGAPMVETDYNAAIDEALDAWNANYSFSDTGEVDRSERERGEGWCSASDVPHGALYLLGIWGVAGLGRRRRRRA